MNAIHKILPRGLALVGLLLLVHRAISYLSGNMAAPTWELSLGMLLVLIGAGWIKKQRS